MLSQTEGFLTQVLTRTASVLHPWRVSVRKMKHIYHILNLCSVRERCLIGEVWCPVADLPVLQGALARASVRKSSRQKKTTNEPYSLGRRDARKRLPLWWPHLCITLSPIHFNGCIVTLHFSRSSSYTRYLLVRRICGLG